LSLACCVAASSPRTGCQAVPARIAARTTIWIDANLLTTMDQNCADDSASLQNNAVESPRMLVHVSLAVDQTNLKSARRSSSLILRAWLCCDAARRLAFWLEAWVNTRAAKGVAAWRSSPAVPASMSRVASKRIGSAHTFRSQLSFSVVVLR
jgi:hypothetical protein